MSLIIRGENRKCTWIKKNAFVLVFHLSVAYVLFIRKDLVNLPLEFVLMEYVLSGRAAG